MGTALAVSYRCGRASLSQAGWWVVNLPMLLDTDVTWRTHPLLTCYSLRRPSAQGACAISLSPWPGQGRQSLSLVHEVVQKRCQGGAALSMLVVIFITMLKLKPWLGEFSAGTGLPGTGTGLTNADGAGCWLVSR